MPLLRAKELTEIITRPRSTHAFCDKRPRRRAESGAAAVSYAAHRALLVRTAGPDSLDELALEQPLWFTNAATAADDVALIAFHLRDHRQAEGHGAFPSRRDRHVRLLPAIRY